MKRNDIEFSVPTEQLIRQCKEQVVYHDERLTWWQEERAKTEEELRAGGLQLRPRQVTGGAHMEAILDPEMARRMAECENKISHHKYQRDEYELWVIGFEEFWCEETYRLHYDDLRYFGLGGTE